jgi:RNA polymerase sigma factor (TIGR02999 family)
MNEVTQLLASLHAGDGSAASRLYELVYSELRAVAARQMRRESPGHTLQPTALIHEAWLRLGADAAPHWKDRAHFFAAASEAMRRILVECARRRLALRRGGGATHEDLEALEIAAPMEDERLLALNEALERFAVVDRPKAELVKLRYFMGLTLEEASESLGISQPTAKRWWAYARAWRFMEVQGQDPTGGEGPPD